MRGKSSMAGQSPVGVWAQGDTRTAGLGWGSQEAYISLEQNSPRPMRFTRAGGWPLAGTEGKPALPASAQHSGWGCVLGWGWVLGMGWGWTGRKMGCSEAGGAVSTVWTDPSWSLAPRDHRAYRHGT